MCNYNYVHCVSESEQGLMGKSIRSFCIKTFFFPTKNFITKDINTITTEATETMIDDENIYEYCMNMITVDHSIEICV